MFVEILKYFEATEPRVRLTQREAKSCENVAIGFFRFGSVSNCHGFVSS